MYPVTGVWTSVLAHRHRVIAQHKNLVAIRIKLPGRKFTELKQLSDSPKKLLHAIVTLARFEARLVLRIAAAMPRNIVCAVVNDGGDIIAPKRGIETLNRCNIGLAHAGVSHVGSVIV